MFVKVLWERNQFIDPLSISEQHPINSSSRSFMKPKYSTFEYSRRVRPKIEDHSLINKVSCNCDRWEDKAHIDSRAVARLLIRSGVIEFPQYWCFARLVIVGGHFRITTKWRTSSIFVFWHKFRKVYWIWQVARARSINHSVGGLKELSYRM